MQMRRASPQEIEVSTQGIQLLPTHITGLDQICAGGLPLNRATLVSGTAGSAKTVFATQFLAEGIRQAGENGVLVTLEEYPEDIRAAMASFGWDLAAWEAEGKLAIVNGSVLVEEEESFVGDYDLGGLLARIEAAVKRVGARRLSMDALSAFFSRFQDHGKIRSELFRIIQAIRKMGVTSVLTTERTGENGQNCRYGVEEFVADNVIILRNTLEMEQRYRSLEILKMRGVAHRRGEFPFVVVDGRGIEVIPLSAIPLEHPSSRRRTTFGDPELDALCGGGPFSDTAILVSGPTGSGKTVLATEFATGGAATGERCLFLGFEESRNQLLRNASNWGRDFSQLEAEGRLKIICEYPSSASLEDRLVRIKDLIDEYQPQRLVLDSLTALGRLVSEKAIRDFTVGLTSFVKRAQITALFTGEVGQIIGATEVTDKNLSSLADGIILLRYVEIGSQVYRGITILKMRGTGHDHQIREYTIDNQGLQVGPPFQQVHGVLTGSAWPVLPVGGNLSPGAAPI